PIRFIGRPGVINNAGTLRKSAGTGTTSIDGAFLSNTGAVEVGAGTLRLGNSPTTGSSSTGSFTVQAGATLDFGFGTHRLEAASDVSGAGRVRFGFGASVTLAGGYNVASTAIDGGSADFTTDAVTGALTLSNGEFGGGTLTGAGTMWVTGQTTWTGGTM